MQLGSLSDMSGMALKVTISSPEPELPLASGTGQSLMLTKRIAAFVNEIVDTIKYDKDNRQDKTSATNEAHRELHGELQCEPMQANHFNLKISKFAGLPLSSDDHQLANNFDEFFYQQNKCCQVGNCKPGLFSLYQRCQWYRY